MPYTERDKFYSDAAAHFDSSYIIHTHEPRVSALIRRLRVTEANINLTLRTLIKDTEHRGENFRCTVTGPKSAAERRHERLLREDPTGYARDFADRLDQEIRYSQWAEEASSEQV